MLLCQKKNVLLQSVYWAKKVTIKNDKTMLKRLLTIGALACTMFIGGTAIAQNDGQKQVDYQKSGFWSNWSIGFDVMFSHELDNTRDGVDIDIEPWKLGHNSNIGGEILLEKEVSDLWTYRFSVSAPGIFGHGADSIVFNIAHDSCAAFGYDRYISVIPVGLKLNLNNWLCGYKPESRWNMYLYGGVGFGINRGGKQYGAIALLAEAALGSQWKVGKGWDTPKHNGSILFTELALDNTCDIPNIFKGNGNMLTAMLKVGYMYNFGITAADQEVIAQKSRLNEEYVSGLENQISLLEQDLAKSKQAEQRLQNRVNQLEKENADLRNQLVVAKETAVKDAVAEVKKEFREKQTNLYGLPFSVQFGIDQYRVSGAERTKLKAIAEIMKNDTTVKYTIAGFCDASGSEEYNQKLSIKRAESVKKELVKRYGVNEDQLTVAGYGKGKPFGNAKYSINRRVSFYANID